jgi:hypothetical protein
MAFHYLNSASPTRCSILLTVDFNSKVAFPYFNDTKTRRPPTAYPVSIPKWPFLTRMTSRSSSSSAPLWSSFNTSLAFRYLSFIELNRDYLDGAYLALFQSLNGLSLHNGFIKVTTVA